MIFPPFAYMKSTNIKLICTDIDGTLLNVNRELSQHTIDVINQLKNEIPIILISSRMPSSMRLLQEELHILDLPLIAYNGSLILDQSNCLLSKEIDVEVIEAIVAAVNATNIHASLYSHDDWYVPSNDYWAKREANNTRIQPTVQPILKTLQGMKKRKVGAHKIMCMGPKEEINILHELLTSKYSNQVHAYRSKDTYIEISHIDQDKFSALAHLMKIKYPTLQVENTLAFGDNYNDKTLLENAGQGVAVANAKDEILAVAKIVTASNINDGVAHYLHDQFLAS